MPRHPGLRAVRCIPAPSVFQKMSESGRRSFENHLVLDSGLVRPSATSLPDSASDLYIAVIDALRYTIPTSEHHPKSLLSAASSCPNASLGQRMQRPSLAGDSCTDARVEASHCVERRV